MIQYNSKNWFSAITKFHKSDTIRILLPEICILALYTLGICYLELEIYGPLDIFKDTLAIHSLVGFVLSLLLVFRTNSAYERWWEGRKLWGQMVNVSRNLAMKLHTLVPPARQAERNFFARMISNYVIALKNHLRRTHQPDELDIQEQWLQETTYEDHVPNTIATRMYAELNKLNQNDSLSGEKLYIIDQELRAFSDITGGCERIRNTPIPFSYSMFLKKFIFIYIVTLPLGLVVTFKYWTIPVVIFIFYALVSMEILAEEIEDPFGTDANDLPTDQLSQTITANVKKILASDLSS